MLYALVSLLIHCIYHIIIGGGGHGKKWLLKEKHKNFPASSTALTFMTW